MNNEFIEFLIKNVEVYPCLWDTSSRFYNKREPTDQAWADISTKCRQPEKLCRNKWKNVRTGLFRSLAKNKRFYLHDEMKFMFPVFESLASKFSTQDPANSTTNYYLNGVSGMSDDCEENNDNVIKHEDCDSNSEPMNSDELDKYENVTVELTPEIGYFSQLCSSSPSTESIQNRTTQKPENIDTKINCLSMKRRRKSNIDNYQNMESKEEQALMSFFKGITADVLSLSIKNQRFFKRKLVELVDDLHREDETNEKC